MVIGIDVNKDRICKDKDKDKDLTYSYLLQVAANLQSLSGNNNEHKVKVHNIWL